MSAGVFRSIEDEIARANRVCATPGCFNSLPSMASGHRKYCNECRDARKANANIPRPPRYDRVCHREGCENIISKDRPAITKFCCAECRKQHANRITAYDQRLADVEALFAEASEEVRKEALRLERRNRLGQFVNMAEPTEAEIAEDPSLRMRRGPLYDKFKAAGYLERIEAGVITPADAAKMFNTSAANVNGWMAAYAQEQRNRLNNTGWELGPRAVEALKDFSLFRRTYFVDEWGKPYVTTEYHLRWIESILHAMEVGGRLMILSPPRFGKTSLLTHFCIWLILRNPNIRIVWVGLNSDIAGQSTDIIRDLLENNEKLVADFLPSGESFRPATGSGRPWQSQKFTTATRTISLASPTMLAIGKTGKMLSRDVDLMVIDDIIDHDSTRSPAEREDDLARVNTQLSSRKESHTALMIIGSRQHHEDLYSSTIENQSWRTIIEQAHDRDCVLPRHEVVLPEGHDDWGEATCEICRAHQDCLLWPEKRTMAWLEGQRFALNNEDHFEMMYNNFTKPASALYITKEDIEMAYNRDRPLGHIPQGTTLIAGLDPASINVQAAFLWAYHPLEDRRYMVDLDTDRGGGLVGARRIVEQWHKQYGLKIWIIERNGFQGAILEDTELLKYSSSNGISLKPHFTDRFNKWDPGFGVTKQFTLFRQFGPVMNSDQAPSGVDRPKIDIPYMDPAAHIKAHIYRDRLLAFETATKSTETDIVMAAWFPETEIRHWKTQQSSEIIYEYDQTGYGIEMMGDSYIGLIGA